MGRNGETGFMPAKKFADQDLNPGPYLERIQFYH